MIRAKELTDEARLLSRHHIDTLEQLTVHRTGAESEINADIEQRKALYRRLRTKAVLSAPEQQEQIKAEITVLSGRIKELRREVRLRVRREREFNLPKRNKDNFSWKCNGQEV